MSGHGKGSRSDPQDLSRRTFMGYVGTVTATCAAGALGIRCGGEEGPEARKHPDRHDVSIDGYFQSRFGLGLDNIYWGDLHTHTLYSFDAPIWCRCQALPEDSCRFARDPGRGNLDFVSLTDHAEIPPVWFKHSEDADLWQSLLRVSREFNNEDPAAGKPLIIFPGWEYTNTHMLRPWIGTSAGYGHKCVIFKDLDQVLPTRLTTSFPGSGSEVVASDAAALWEKLAAFRPSSPGNEGFVLTIPHTPSMNGELPSGDHRTDWNYMDGDFVRNVEICSKHGNAEGPPPEEIAGGPEEALLDYIPDRNDETITMRRLLYRRWVRDGNGLFRMSFVGGTDNHMGQPGNDVVRQCDPTGGVLPFRGTLTGIAAPALTRDALWSGLWRRHTLSTTTGPNRMPVLMAVETAGRNILMGENGPHDGTVRLRVLAPSGIDRIEVVLDGCLLFTVSGGILDEELPLGEGRHYLYVRAARAQPEGLLSMSWTSPVYLGDEASQTLAT
jgi:hypothetical protein